MKEIKRGVTKASVVLDKHCPRIVQPYRLTDNVASVGTFTAQEGMKGIGNAFSNFNPGKSRSPPPQNVDIPASTKLAAKQMNWLPMRAEVLYGERSHNEETNVLDRESRLGQKFYPIADKMLQQVLSNVREPHEYEFKLFILKNATRNAYARPGGFVYLDQGLIDSSAQHPKAFFALAHEIAHVLQRHETKELQSMIVDSIQTKNDLTKVMSRVRTDPGVILGHVKIQKNLFTQHHVDQELQSDSCAARLLSRVFPDPQQLANALQAFLKDLPKPTADKAAKRPQNDAEKIAATAHSIVNDPVKRHPTTQQRYENLRAIYNEIVGGAPTKQR